MVFIFCTSLLCIAYIFVTIIRSRSIERENEAHRKHELQLLRASKSEGLPSPYILKREISQSTERWGYSIFDTRTNKFVSSSGYYEVFYTTAEALQVMNNLEVVEGFDTTVL